MTSQPLHHFLCVASGRIRVHPLPSEAVVMRCLLLLAILSFSLVPLDAADDAPRAGTSVALRVNGIIRFGPNTGAPAVMTLPAGAVVEVLGEAPGAPGWYTIRFPREGHAWMHEKVLQPLDGGKRFRVVEDKARVRDDSTLKGNIVAELAVNDVVDSQGKQNGQWYAIYPPKAIAYVHQKILELQPQQAAALSQDQIKARAADRLWKQANETYGTYANSSTRAAMTLDWTGLGDQMQRVIETHASQAVRLEAQRLKEGIDRVVRVQTSKGYRATTKVPEPEPAPMPPIARNDPKPQPQPATTDGQQPTSDAPQTTTQPQPTDTTASPTPKPNDPQIKQADPAPSPTDPSPAVATNDESKQDSVQRIIGETAKPAATSAGNFRSEGFIEKRDVPGFGARDVVIDDRSNIAGILQAREGRQIEFSEYYWRYTEVKGEKRSSDQGDVPLIIVDEVRLVGQ
jgi:hypothetical protein